jgi:hypothetical protein
MSSFVFSLYKCSSVLYKLFTRKLLTSRILHRVGRQKFINVVEEPEPCISARKTFAACLRYRLPFDWITFSLTEIKNKPNSKSEK